MSLQFVADTVAEVVRWLAVYRTYRHGLGIHIVTQYGKGKLQ